ncbi:hypothetical protein AWB77_06741 [Caballeronia fortuita]|uniref:Uncharacterized protein n=1 Tax=Caballeronia fortuita TaxID=1777138 RepID=A0A158E939_9BURK|nr:hypothetical protein [Caballeronia fortuita]SAL03220.1 hypothetical protein AWB77_06741 [Caballeronia fortuita]
MPLLGLSEIERLYVTRANTAPSGAITPKGSHQISVCERLVEKGEFVRLADGAYTTPSVAQELGLRSADK